MIFELIQPLFDSLFQAQSIADSINCVPLQEGGPSSCPASALHAVTAAFATQGYWVQADILNFLSTSSFETWAILIYLIAAISGIISMAMGFPPKLYLWFFLGPAVYHWLIDTTIPVAGVRWNVGPTINSNIARQERAQREVWKLAEPGISSTNIAQNGTYNFGGAFKIQGLNLRSGIGKVRVSYLFLWIDMLFSDLVEWFIRWTGVFNLPGSEASILSGDLSNLPKILGGGRAADILGLISGGDPSDDMHWLLSNLKWRYVEDITSAKLSSVDMRDAFVTFLGSECGEALQRSIDEAKFISARNATGVSIPDSIFLQEGTRGAGGALGGILSGAAGAIGGGLGGVGGAVSGALGGSPYEIVTKNLATTSIPTPKEMKELLYKDGVGSFRKSVPFLSTVQFQNSGAHETLRCDQYLYLLVQGFRWEAGHIYYQMITSLPPGVTPVTLMYTMFYGWPIHNLKIDDLLGQGGILGALGAWSQVVESFNPATLVREYTPDGQAALVTDLILLHLFRNEFNIAPRPFTERRTGSQNAIDYSLGNQRDVGSKQKFGEIYTWAMMLPYLQGVLLYLLAISYPFICMFILVPGWHKLLFTWMTFWVWVKMWDIGFAIVIVLERSIWAMLGNSSDAVRLMSRVWSLQNHGKVQWQCPSGGLSFGLNPPYGLCQPGAIPSVIVGTKGGGIVGFASPVSLPSSGAGTEYMTWIDSIQIFDKIMTMASAMDLDLANSYYIYLMSALYFAVPAVTGQIVLGAKAGATSLATQAIQSSAQEIGRSAGSGYSGDLQARASANQQSLAQAATAKAYRQDAGGYAAGALAYGNQGLRADVEGSLASSRSQALGNQSRVLGALVSADRTAAMNAGLGGISGVLYGGSTLTSGFNNIGKASAGVIGQNLPISEALKKANLASDGFTAAMGVTPGMVQALQSVAGMANYGIERGNRQRQAEMDAMQNRNIGQGFLSSAQGKGYNQAAGMAASAAEQNAGAERFAALNNFAAQTSGFLKSRGIESVLTPGPKPTDLKGMSMVGALGGPMQAMAQYTSPTQGTYFGHAQSWFNGFDNAYGFNPTYGLWAEGRSDGPAAEIKGLMEASGPALAEVKSAAIASAQSGDGLGFMVGVPAALQDNIAANFYSGFLNGGSGYSPGQVPFSPEFVPLSSLMPDFSASVDRVRTGGSPPPATPPTTTPSGGGGEGNT
jgi:hypothetical protein